jgi:hypothetical protein
MTEQVTGEFFKQKSEMQRIKTDFTWQCETPDKPQYAQCQSQ